jgi:hypothetical protein
MKQISHSNENNRKINKRGGCRIFRTSVKKNLEDGALPALGVVDSRQGGGGGTK